MFQSPPNKKNFHGKPVAIDVKDLSKGIINPAPVVAKAPDFRKKVDPDLLKGVGYLLGSTPEDFKNWSISKKGSLKQIKKGRNYELFRFK